MLLGLAASPSDIRRAERSPGGGPSNGDGGGQKGTAPAFSAGPEILGTGWIGTVLEVQPGAVTGNPAPDLSFQWQRGGAAIAGAKAPLHTVRPEDDLGELSCRVSATNPSGAAVAETPAVIARHAPPVAGSSLPDVTLQRGTGNQNIDTSVGFMGENLRFSINTVIGVTIDPQTGLVTVDTSDPLAATSVTVTAKNSGGKDSATFSLKVQDPIVQEPPAFDSQPQILGEPVIGTKLALELSDVTGTPDPVLSYEWHRDGAPINGAESAAYILQPADDLAAISCRITAINAAGSAVAETAAVTAIHLSPQLAADLVDQVFQRDSGIQTIEAGAAFFGAALIYSVTGPKSVAIDAQTGVVSIKTDDPLAATPVTVTATNSGGVASADFSLAVHEVPAFDGLPQIEGEPVIGGTLSLVPPQVTGMPSPMLSCKWQRDGAAIAEATETSYTLQPADDLAAISCRVTATNAAGSAVAETDTVTATRSAPQTIANLADQVFQQNTGVQTIKAAPAFAGEALAYSVSGPAGISIDASTGEISVSTTELLPSTKITVTAANSGGSAQVSFAVTVGQAVQTPVLSALEADTEVVPPVVSFQTDQDGIAYWLVTANPTSTAAEIKDGGGEASGQVAVEEGVVTEGIELSKVTVEVVRYFHVMVENASGQSNVLTLAFQVQAQQTQWSTDFSEYSTGSAPSDWTSFDSGFLDTWGIVSGGLVSSNRMRIRQSARVGPFSAAAFFWDVLPDVENSEVLMLVSRGPNATTNNLHGVAQRAAISGNAVDGLFLGTRNGGNDITQRRIEAWLVEGANNTPIQGGGSYEAGNAIWLRCRWSGTNYRMKGWLADQNAGDLGLSNEPSAWGLDGTFEANKNPGKIAICQYVFSSSPAQSEIFAHYFGVGIDGETAPAPTFS